MATIIRNKRSSTKGIKPTASKLQSGEIALNLADGDEKIFIKNSANEIVEFSSDEQINAKIQELRDIIFSTEFVDLDLPSGTKWLKRNVGAKKESDIGLYFQWGDTVGYADETTHSTWKTTPGNSGASEYDETAITAWDTDNLWNDGDVPRLKSSVDAVYVRTYGKAQTATSAQWSELLLHTNHEDTVLDGTYVTVFTSLKDPSKRMIIPQGTTGYWTSSLDDGSGKIDTRLASFATVSDQGEDVVGMPRCENHLIRGVLV